MLYLYIGLCYVTPDDSSRQTLVESKIFDRLLESVLYVETKAQNNCNVFIYGDFTRSSIKPDFVVGDDELFIKCVQLNSRNVQVFLHAGIFQYKFELLLRNGMHAPKSVLLFCLLINMYYTISAMHMYICCILMGIYCLLEFSNKPSIYLLCECKKLTVCDYAEAM